LTVGNPDAVGAVPWQGGPLVFVEDLDQPELSAADHHHLARVRRVRDGDRLVIADGSGHWMTAVMAGTRPEPTGGRHRGPEPEPEITIAFALTKGHKPDLVVQKLTELGVDRLVPFVAARSVVRWDDRQMRAHHQRWQVVAREAAMQSRRAAIPVVEEVESYAQVAARPGACRADDGGGAPSLAKPVVLIGPEGGWSEEERRVEIAGGSLGAGVLRAETAAIAAATMLGALRAELVAERN